jgi:hypothetical protein
MTSDDRWDHLIALDEELLKGGVILSEWCSFIVREADTAFTSGAHLASILVAVSGVEAYLRSEYSAGKRERLAALIHSSPIDTMLKQDIHTLRKYRNKWIHVDDPWSDGELLQMSWKKWRSSQFAFFVGPSMRTSGYNTGLTLPLQPTAFGVG